MALLSRDKGSEIAAKPKAPTRGLREAPHTHSHLRDSSSSDVANAGWSLSRLNTSGSQRKHAAGRSDGSNKAVARQSDGPNAKEQAPAIVGEVLRSPGKPLDSQIRSFFEPRFGHDFSKVRVHSDEKAAASARSINALAYTAGNNVVFAHGRYAPGTTNGQQLLAHELTHVVQQDHTSVVPGLAIGAPDHD